MRSSALPKYILLLLSFISLLLAPYQTWAADHQDLDTLRTSAEKGSSEAQFKLGVAYANGQGVPKDSTLAYAWESLAAISGDEKAVEARNSLAAQLNPKALAKAQALAGSLQKKIDSRQKKE